MGVPGQEQVRRRLGWALLLLGALGLWSAQISPAEDPTIEPAESASGFYWRPSSVTLASGASATFRNPSNIVAHGLAWTGGPAQPSCSGVPVGSSGTAWSGSCTFAEAGTYSFVCTVHPTEMKG